MDKTEEDRLNRLNSIGNEINDIYNNLIGTENTKPYIPEYVFVNVFLPLFAGEKDLKYKVTLGNWYIVAGNNGYTEVDVVNDRGEVLFTVPPLLNRNKINSDSGNQMTWFQVLATARQYGSIHPNQGKAYLKHAIENRKMIVNVPKENIEQLKIWNSIFKRYGKPEILGLEESSAEVEIKKNNLVFGEDDFDLL